MAIKAFEFGKHKIGSGQPTFIIAEIGINHEGNVDVCAKMIEKAVWAGADAIKLQTSDPEENYMPHTESYSIYKKAFLGPEQTGYLFKLTRELHAEPFTTAGYKTLDWVRKLNPSGYKISSGTLGHIPLIAKTAAQGKPLLMSTGISSEEEISYAVDIAKKNGAPHIALLQCTSLYPAPLQQLHLSAIRWLQQKYKVNVGFSDHSLGVKAAPLAVAAGACIIEKHFTLDKKRKSFDHKISLEPSEFKKMVKEIRETEKIMGSPVKKLSSEQHHIRKRMARYLIISHDLPKGHILQEEDLLVLRTGEGSEGLEPKYFYDFLGKKIKRNIPKYALVTKDLVHEA